MHWVCNCAFTKRKYFQNRVSVSCRELLENSSNPNLSLAHQLGRYNDRDIPITGPLHDSMKEICKWINRRHSAAPQAVVLLSIGRHNNRHDFVYGSRLFRMQLLPHNVAAIVRRTDSCLSINRFSTYCSQRRLGYLFEFERRANFIYKWTQAHACCS